MRQFTPVLELAVVHIRINRRMSHSFEFGMIQEMSQRMSQRMSQGMSQMDSRQRVRL